MVTSLKAQLDGILIYAGLFAGVNSAFLALTLPEMRADPADDTNALLLHLVTGGNGNITSADDLPSASFSPASGIFPVNILFSLSLTLALLASFLAVLGQQWLVYYRKRSGGGAEVQRWEQLRRYLGAKRWRLEAMLDDILPSLLQMGLILFCIALALYLGTLSQWICYTVAIPMGLALVCILFMAVSAAVDQWCPFKSPLSRAMQLIPPSVARPIWFRTLYGLSWASTEGGRAVKAVGRVTGPVTRWVGRALSTLWLRSTMMASSGKKIVSRTIRFVNHRVLGKALKTSPVPNLPMDWRLPAVGWASRVANSIPRPPEPVHRLNAIAAKRVLCTSEDANALIYTAVNLQALESPEDIHWLLCDVEFYNRLKDEWATTFGSLTLNPRASDPKSLRIRASYSAFTCLVLSSGSASFLLAPDSGVTSFPPSADERRLQQVFEELGGVIRRMDLLAQTLRRTSKTFEPSPQTLCHNLLYVILRPLRWQVLFDQWFEDNAALYNENAPGRPFAPLTACLLAYAIQSFTKVPPNISFYDFDSDWLKNEETLWSLSRNKDYAEWGCHAACNIIRIYSTWRKRGYTLLYNFPNGKGTWSVLGPLREAFVTVQLDPSTRPSNSVYVSLLQQCWDLFGNVQEMDTLEARDFLAATAIDLSAYFIRSVWESTLSNLETAQLRNDSSHCIKIIGKALPTIWTKLPLLGPNHGLLGKLVEFLELVSAGLKRGMAIFDETVASEVLKLEECLPPVVPAETDQNDLEEYQKVYLEIKYKIKDMGFTNSARSNAVGNPADPPTTQVVEATSGRETSSSRSD